MDVLIMTRRMKNNLKHELYAKCCCFVEERRAKLQHHIAGLQDALASETKSSAGDKHETGRAMLQLEREKAGQQLAIVENLNEALSRIDLTKTSTTIVMGSVVLTSKANYFLAISAGQLAVGAEHFFAISPHTPMGRLLMGKKVGDAVVFNNLEFVIEAVE